MRRSPFWSQASISEKGYLIGTGFLMGLTMFGHFYSRQVHFTPAPGIARLILVATLPLAFLHWLPLYRDRHPDNPVPSFSPFKRAACYVTLFVASYALVCLPFSDVIAPFVTRSFGTPASGELIVTRKSSGARVRKDCDHFVWLRDGNSPWVGKVCLSEQFWETVEVRQVLKGSWKSTALGRTIEELAPRAE